MGGGLGGGGGGRGQRGELRKVDARLGVVVGGHVDCCCVVQGV